MTDTPQQEKIQILEKMKIITSELSNVPFLKTGVSVILLTIILSMYINVKADRDRLQAKLNVYETGTNPASDSTIKKNVDEKIILINDIKQSKNRLDSLIQNSKKDTLSIEEALLILKGVK